MHLRWFHLADECDLIAPPVSLRINALIFCFEAARLEIPHLRSLHDVGHLDR
jgi:hypothetical protein